MLATVSLAAALAFGGANMGCGSNSGSGSGSSSGVSESGTDTGSSSGVVDSGKGDTGSSSGVIDSGTPDTGPGIDSSLTPTATPTCNPNGGTFTTPQPVTLADTTAGATIFYTTDGTNPNPNSQVYVSALSVAKTEQIRAYAKAPGFADSAVQSCSFTINIQPGTCNPPSPSPAGGTFDNDFPLAITTSGTGTQCGTICYTLDGTAATCDQTTGACTGTSKTYDAATRIPINGTVTGNPKKGQVVLNAIACAANTQSTAMAPAQTYTLQVATPTLQGAPAAPLYTGAGINPTVASSTSGATGLFSQSSGILTTDPNGTSCTNGNVIGALPSHIAIADTNGVQTVFVVGCKAGYADSLTLINPYNFTLNPPSVSATGGSNAPGPYDHIVLANVNDALNAGTTPAEWSCVSTTATPPTCSATACTNGQKVTDGQQIKATQDTRTGTGAGDINVDQTVISGVACSGSYASSAPFASTTKYSLTLAPVAFTCSNGGAFGSCTANGNANSTIPNGGSVVVKAAEGGTGASEPYDFICVTTDNSAPNCTCTPSATVHKCPSATDATCDAALPKWTSAAFNQTNAANGATVQAAGCLASPALNTFGDVFASTSQTQSVTGTNSMSPPTLSPATAVINNPPAAGIQFTNNGPDAAYFCYTVDNTVPAKTAGATPACFAAGSTPTANGSTSTYCTNTGGAAGIAKSSTSTDGPFWSGAFQAGLAADPHGAGDQQQPIQTGQWVQVIACDSTATALKPSAPVSLQYTLQVGTPTITTKASAFLGQTIVITDVTAGTTINYSTDTTVPDCTNTNFHGVTDTCATTADCPTGYTCTATHCFNGSTTTPLYASKYYAMGHETAGNLQVIGCKAGYSSSTGTDSTVYTYKVQTPIIGYTDPNGAGTGSAAFVPAPSGTGFDDYLSAQLREPVDGTGGGIPGTWWCAGATPSCGAANGLCGGTNTQTPIGPDNSCGVTFGPDLLAHSAVQPSAAPQCLGSGLQLPNSQTLGSAPQVISCIPTTGANAPKTLPTLSGSASASIAYTFTSSAITAPTAAPTDESSITFVETTSALGPLGDATHLASTGGYGTFDGTKAGAGSGWGVGYVCAGPFAGPISFAQPSQCNGFANCSGTTPFACTPVVPGWSCVSSLAGATPQGVGPTLTMLDQGVTGPWSAFSCKDGLTWSTESSTVTFTGYTHTNTSGVVAPFTPTGAVTDFTTHTGLGTPPDLGGEDIGAQDGATAYLSWDATNLYVGFSYGALSTANDTIHFYVGSKNGTGTAAADNGPGNTESANLPATTNPTGQKTPTNFNAQWHVFWKADNTAQGIDHWNGTAWAAVAGATAGVHYNAGSTFVEFALPLSTFAGVNGQLSVLGADWTGAGGEKGAWPAQADPAAGGYWTAFQSINTSYAFEPNDSKMTCAAASTACLQ